MGAPSPKEGRPWCSSGPPEEVCAHGPVRRRLAAAACPSTPRAWGWLLSLPGHRITVNTNAYRAVREGSRNPRRAAT